MNPSVTTQVPETDTIAARCMLVSVNFSMPPQSKKDRKLTQETADAHKASNKALAVTQYYWPEGTLDAVRSIEGHVRNNVLNHYGFPSQTRGAYIVPGLVMLDFLNDLNKALAEHKAQIESDAAKLETWIEQSKLNRNGLFNREDYPADKQAFIDAFTVNVTVLPYPTGESFGLVAMADAALAEVKTLAAKQNASLSLNVHKELVQRIKEPLIHLIKTLKSDSNRWQSSTVENLRTIAQMCKPMNLAKDAALDAFAAEIDNLLKGVSMEALKDNKTLREDTAKKADAISARMSQYGF